MPLPQMLQGRKRHRDLFRTSSQWWAYNDCITRFAHRHRWLAFIDVDEFIVLHDQVGGSRRAAAWGVTFVTDNHRPPPIHLQGQRRRRSALHCTRLHRCFCVKLRFFCRCF